MSGTMWATFRLTRCERRKKKETAANVSVFDSEPGETLPENTAETQTSNVIKSDELFWIFLYYIKGWNDTNNNPATSCDTLKNNRSNTVMRNRKNSKKKTWIKCKHWISVKICHISQGKFFSNDLVTIVWVWKL